MSDGGERDSRNHVNSLSKIYLPPSQNSIKEKSKWRKFWKRQLAPPNYEGKWLKVWVITPGFNIPLPFQSRSTAASQQGAWTYRDPPCCSAPLRRRLEEGLGHRWQTQDLRAKLGPSPCFIHPAPCSCPVAALSSRITVKKQLHLYSPKITFGPHEADVAPGKSEFDTPGLWG